MDITNIKKELFKRDLSGEEDFLDDYWTLEVKNVAKNDSRLEPYFENVDYSDIEISVAGKASGVNEAAFQTALEVLSELHVYLEKLSPDIELHSEQGWWHLGSIWFPYQQEKMWYLHLWSEYGADLEYCYVKKGGEYIGCFIGFRDNDSVAQVLPNIKYVITSLKQMRVESPAFKDLLEKIASSETIGREFILPLLSIVEAQKDHMEPDTYSDLVEELNEIKRHAIA